ncbi:MAG TPA: efflux RND transporter periplasmic adaptor subunit [Anaeromyxobacter sp.]|nr:efflux RND transporter periplasmic adaptor subunit [Anaeromyxobacter sp.]
MKKIAVRTLPAVLLALLFPAAAAAGPARAPLPTAKVRLVAAHAPGAGRFVAGNVLAARRATVSTRLSATVKAVHVDEGRAVQAGQLLVSLADEDLRGALEAAQAALASAAAHERRIVGLARERAATPSEVEAARSQRAQADAAVAAARANLAHGEIRAPFAGTVQARRIDPGDLVGPGQPLLELEGGGLELVASLSEEEARGLAVGSQIRFQAGSARGQAVVTALTPGGDALSHRRGLKARVTVAPEALRSGAFARLEVPGAGSATSAVWVPRSAVVERGDLTGVFVAAGGKAELRWLSIGEPVGEHVPVRAGLRGDEPVIDAPGALRDGQAVEVVDAR